MKPLLSSTVPVLDIPVKKEMRSCVGRAQSGVVRKWDSQSKM
jgi:hypothetical protein